MAYEGIVAGPAIKEDGTPCFQIWIPPWEIDWDAAVKQGAIKTPGRSNPSIKKYLGLAIQAYEGTLGNYAHVLHLTEPMPPVPIDAFMGLAWCYEQDGQLADAIRLYRNVHEQAWKYERDALFSSTHFLTIHSGYALLRLLPADETTVNERAALEDHIKTLEKKPLPPA